MEESTKKGLMMGCLTSTLIMIICFFAILTLFAFSIRGCVEAANEMPENGVLSGEQTAPEKESDFKKIWISGDGAKTAPEVLRIKISGVITPGAKKNVFDIEEDTSSHTAFLKIKAAAKDSSIRGLWLDINTPGGTVTESDIIHNAISDFKTSASNRFVFVHMGDMCCSGGYYISANADCIMAHPTTITGSIGVMMGGINAAKLAKKIGIESVTIASAGNKNLLNPLKDIDPEHIEILRKPVIQMYNRFLSIVSKGRKIPVDTLRPLADGRIFSAVDAKANMLIDCIGYEKDAAAKVLSLTGAKSMRVYRYQDQPNLKKLFSSSLLFENAGSIIRELKTSTDETLTPAAEFRFR